MIHNAISIHTDAEKRLLMLKYWMVANLAMALTISFMTRCGNNYEMTERNHTAKVVQRNKTEGTAITTYAGGFGASQQKMLPG